MTKLIEEFEQWFTSFWWLYPNDLCDKKKGSKFKAKQAAEKLYKKGGIEELVRIKLNTEALIRYDNKEYQRNGRPDRWPHASSYLNQGYYDREIESVSEKHVPISSTCFCGQEAIVMGQCHTCYYKNDSRELDRKKMLKDSWEKVKERFPRDEGEGLATYAKRCARKLGYAR